MQTGQFLTEGQRSIRNFLNPPKYTLAQVVAFENNKTIIVRPAEVVEVWVIAVFSKTYLRVLRVILVI